MRITKKDLDSKVELLNNMTGNPTKAYAQEKGKLLAQVGSYVLDGAYGGWGLGQICSEGGGQRTIIGGHRPKKELFDMIDIFMEGIFRGVSLDK